MSTRIEEALVRLVEAVTQAAHGGCSEAAELCDALKEADRALREAGYVADGITGETYFKETT